MNSNLKDDCLFCKIIKGEIPSNKVYEDDDIFAFFDIAPVKAVHVLVIPKHHIESVNDISSENSHFVSKVFEKIPIIAKEAGIDSYRVVSNVGPLAGQTVLHLHFHIIGGEPLGKMA